MGKPGDEILPPFTAAQCREIDRIAINEWGVPGIVLMENAGRGATDIIASMIETELSMRMSDARVAIFCGHGNNGGDGYVIARHLANRGANVRAWATKPPGDSAPDAAVNHVIATKMNLVSTKPLDENGLNDATEFAPDIVLDALLGTGIKGPPRPPLPAVVAWCQTWRSALSRVPRRVIAIDVPSGMDCDTGDGLCVAADMTITFAALKIGFAQPNAAAKTGPVRLVDIGAPLAALKQAAALRPSLPLPPRRGL